MSDQQLSNWLQQLKPQTKTAFISVLVIGFLTHTFVFTNTLPNHDGLVNLYSTQDKSDLGRFFLSPFSGISSYFSLPWINGVLSVFYLALMAAALVELFQLEKRISVILTGGLVVTFPAVSSTYAYMFTADGYMAGAMLTVLALLITNKYKYGFLPGSLLFYFGVGVYQANLPFLLTLVAVLLVSDILIRGMKLKEFIIQTIRCGLLTVIGMVLYAVTFRIYRSRSGNISDYQGLSDVGLSIDIIDEAIWQVVGRTGDFFFRGFLTDIPVTLFGMLNIVVFLLIAAGIVLLIIQNRLWQDWLMLLIAFVLLAALPFLSYSLYFISPGVVYHMLMVMALLSFYLLPVIFFDRLDLQVFSNKIFSWMTILAMTLIVFNFAIIANITYFNLDLKYEKTTAFAGRLVSRIDHTPDIDEAGKLAIIGRAQTDLPLTSEIIPQSIPAMTGSSGGLLLTQPYLYQALFNTYYDLSYRLATPPEIQALQETEAYEEMAVWPAENSVRVIDDIIVVKFGE
ncbi:glucosyltransferase domain-containing protein [Planococcus lenghuensis]|uniref:Glucosyltransferase GtrII-like protein n=1 Tax=Planococcus lenghuensis TaxID=2213202 RepID=A0A1Q2L0R9_9BACL|nr:glucosyltransferase domain-containing protein [Planococcus lenghuensis]AQQ54055.1 hypothetical protein B0X71_13730 [Planococcus lenghuensis]